MLTVHEYWDTSYITSPFGDARPGGRTHRGCDWSHSTIPGTPIPSPMAGKVTGKLAPATWHGFGHQVTITGARHRLSFAHLDSASPLQIGDAVDVGELIGAEGTSGSAAGPCVHVEAYSNRFIDPAPVIAQLVAAAPAGGGSAHLRRRSTMTTLYYLKESAIDKKPIYALAGDGQGAAAWIEIRHKPRVDALSKVHGLVVELYHAREWDQYKYAYTGGRPALYDPDYEPGSGVPAPVPPGTPSTLTIELTGTAKPA